MRSVVVVLPASMWAMMPMFLQRSNGTCLDTPFFRSSFRDSCSLTTEPVKALPFSIFFSVSVEMRLVCCSQYRATSDSAQRLCWPPSDDGRVRFSYWAHLYLSRRRMQPVVAGVVFV